MTEVPTISITLDETVEEHDNQDDNETSRRPSISDCHTDIEDLDSDQERNSLITSLKQSMKCNGSVTDVEDYDDSDDNDVDEPEINYGTEISLNEFLDQGTVDESSNVSGNQRNKLEAMHSTAKSPSLTAFHLGVNFDVGGGVTDCEDMADSGDESEENDKAYSDDDKAVILEGGNAVDIHDSVGNRKKIEKFTPRISEVRSSASSSDEEKPKLRVKPKHFTKRNQKCDEAKSDVENIFFSDEERRKSLQLANTPVLETPDIEIMAFDASDTEDVPETPKFPEINISFSALLDVKPKKKTKHRKTPAPTLMLGLPDNDDEGHTDVENLNSSDDDEEDEVKKKYKNLIPIAVIRSDALTDVEDFDDESGEDNDFSERQDFALPSPIRELTTLVENKTGEPMKRTAPLPDNLLLGFQDLDADKGLTDVEDFSDKSGDEDELEDETPEIDCIPDLDGGVVESSDHTAMSSLRASATPEPITDTEDIFSKRQGNVKGQECRRRRTKPKHSNNSQHKPKSNFLDTKFYDDAGAGGAHTDVEDLDVEDDDALLKDKGIGQRRATVDSAARRLSSNINPEGKTDIEYVSGDDDIDLMKFSTDVHINLSDFQFELCTSTRSQEYVDANRNCFLELKLPEFRKICTTPDGGHPSTDVEDCQYNSEYEDCVSSFSRAQTATPLGLKRDLEELCTSEIHEINSGAFDKVKEHFEMKENSCLTESQTDVENIDDDIPQNDDEE